jgi:acetyltransferase-like isoleucine patch superfamily enzyme
MNKFTTWGVPSDNSKLKFIQMKKVVVYIYKLLRKVRIRSISLIYTPIARLQFYLNGACLNGRIKVRGLIKVCVTRRGQVQIGDSFHLNSGNNYNLIGRQQKCIFWVEGKLSIGNNVGISSTAIICKAEINIGNNVIIGGNTVIYDTDFHSLLPSLRMNSKEDLSNALSKRVVIKDNVFIGAHSTILKGVTIGSNSIIGACSVITKDIPDGEVWAGNPARYIRKISL